MAAIDECEPAIIEAFKKDNWEIDQKPYFIRVHGRGSLLADLKLKRLQEGTIENIIVVEVKCFQNPKNDVQDFYIAQGQYNYYSVLLKGKQIPFLSILPFLISSLNV